MTLDYYYEYDSIHNTKVECLKGLMVSADGYKIEVSESQMEYFKSKPKDTVYDLDICKKVNIRDEVLESKLHFYMEKHMGKFTDRIKDLCKTESVGLFFKL